MNIDPGHQLPLNQVIRKITALSNKLNDKSGYLIKNYENLNLRSQLYLKEEKSLILQEQSIENKRCVLLNLL